MMFFYSVILKKCHRICIYILSYLYTLNIVFRMVVTNRQYWFSIKLHPCYVREDSF